MKILSHRGYWQAPAEKNGRAAFERTIASGFGTETDVRDQAGDLVISHDPPRSGAMRLDALLDLFVDGGGIELPLAMNVKADGLAAGLARAFAGRGLDWFVFDMSFPDLREQLRAGNPTFARMSEFEAFPDHLHGQIKGIWLDAFEGDWFDATVVERLLDRGLDVCVVSPELHGRDHRHLWETLTPLATAERFMICTDLPRRACEAFGLTNSNYTSLTL